MKIAFDIDDTLFKIRKEERDQVPDYDLIQVLRWFHNNGDDVYVWSAGGIDYAEMFVKKFGLDGMVTVIPKNGWDGKEEIDIAFDDCETNLAKVDILVRREPTFEENRKKAKEVNKKIEELENMSDEELEYATSHCPKCKKKIVPAKDSVIYGTDKWDGHTYKFDCECGDPNMRLCSG